MAKLFNADKEYIGPESKGKSFIVKPGEKGYMVEELEEGKPTLIATPGQGNPNPSASFLVDSQGNVQEIAPGHPVVIKQPAPPSSPGKTYLVRQTHEGIVTEEFDVGKPIIINAPAPSPGSNLLPILPYPALGSDGQPLFDNDGKPIYVDIEPQLRWMGFQSEQRRANERNQAIIATAKTFREHIGDLVAGMKAAAEEKKAGTKASAPRAGEPQAYQCTCGTQFAVPSGEWQQVKCPNPNCGRIWTREEVLAA